MRDHSLLSRAQDGDVSAFEALVERHRDDLYSFGRRMTHSETDAAEIAQECFLSAYLHLSEFRNESEFAVWALRIAATHASLRLRLWPRVRASEEQLRSPKFHPNGVLANSPGPDWSGRSDQQAFNPKLRRAIEDATDDLPQSHREVLLLKDVAGLSYDEIANITAQSIPAIKDRVHQARLSLRETIDGFYRES
jgi:RNA polymerase sigma-70 factor (ECF subfamily)